MWSELNLHFFSFHFSRKSTSVDSDTLYMFCLWEIRTIHVTFLPTDSAWVKIAHNFIHIKSMGEICVTTYVLYSIRSGIQTSLGSRLMELTPSYSSGFQIMYASLHDCQVKDKGYHCLWGHSIQFFPFAFLSGIIFHWSETSSHIMPSAQYECRRCDWAMDFVYGENFFFYLPKKNLFVLWVFLWGDNKRFTMRFKKK